MSAGISGLMTILFVAFLIFYVVCWWRIWTKAGFHGALSLLMLLPPLSFIGLIYLAFADWPNARPRSS